MLKRTSSLHNIKDLLKRAGEKVGGDDPRFWSPSFNEKGVASAVVRFLPAPKDEPTPFVKVYGHTFKGPGGWYIENCRTTIGEPDPVMEHNRKLWATGDEKNQNTVRSRYRRTSFIANVLVLKDPAQPDKEGKVFLYKFGMKIFDRIKDAADPKFDGVDPFDPFNPWEGADFVLRIAKTKEFPNYDSCQFEKPSALFGGDAAKITAIWEQEHSLQEHLQPSKFKPYAELDAKFRKVIGETAGSAVGASSDAHGETAPAAAPDSPKATLLSVDDNDNEAYFDRLATED